MPLDTVANRGVYTKIVDITWWHDQTVLITGGTGSWGTQAVSQLLALPVRKVIVFSRDEYKQHLLQTQHHDPRLRCFLGDVRDVERLTLAFNEVDVVLHLAALKQVGAGEYHPYEFVQTNIVGTMNVTKAALARKVRKVLFVSSDKAVDAINLYGGTKFVAERLTLAANVYSPAPAEPHFSVARFGNALGSRGSVLQVWREQKAQGIPLTICDPEHTRFLITLRNAVEHCLACVTVMQGGETFIPEMPTVCIGDLARAFAGHRYPVTITGARPGEKAHEILSPTGFSSSNPFARLTIPQIRTLLEQEGYI